MHEQRGGTPPAATPNRRRIGEMLLEEGLINPAQLEEALRLQHEKGGKVVELLIELGHLDSRTFLNFLSRQPGVASIDLLNYSIPKSIIDLVPAEFALRHELVPIDTLGRDLTVAMACPLDRRTIDELSAMTGRRVRPLLVALNDVRVALNRYYTAKKPQALDFKSAEMPGTRTTQERAPESALSLEGVSELVRRIDKLPALPEAVLQIRQAIEDPNAEMRDIAELIRRDPSLTAKLLGLANSPAYAFRHEIDSLERAVALLGLREVYNVVLSCTVVDYFDRKNPFDYKAFWKRSIFAATAATVLARHSGLKERGQYFACGLVHDIGRAVFAELFQQRYSAFVAGLNDDELIRREIEEFGVGHPEAGYILAEHWGLPEDIQQSIRFHHVPELAPSPSTEVIITALAALMADVYGKLNRDNVGAFLQRCSGLLRQLHMEDKTFITVLGETANEVKTHLNIFGASS